MPFRYARAAARSRPSVSCRERCLRSNSADIRASLRPRCGVARTAARGVAGRGETARAVARQGARQAWWARRLRRAAGGAAMALEALALPAPEAPDVALDLAGVDLAAREVHVRARDQAAFVAFERHPLGEDVIGVREPGAAVGLGLVRELDAVLVQEAAGLRQVGHD